MAIYRNVSLMFWTDAKIADEFTPEDKYFYLYLMTNPHTNLCGCYELSVKQAVSETGYSSDTIWNLIKRFSEVHKVAFFCKETKEILLVNWFRYNWFRSPKLTKPLKNEIDSVKNESFKAYLTMVYDDFLHGVDTVSIRYAYGMDTTVSVTVSDTVSVTDDFRDIEKEKDIEKDRVKGKKREKGEEKEKGKFQEVADLYNSICVSFPRLTILSNARKKAIGARLAVYSLEDFTRLFEKAEASDFMRGNNNNNWKATFDWMMNEANFAKILDGNYDNRGKGIQRPINRVAQELEESYEMMKAWAADDGGHGQ